MRKITPAWNGVKGIVAAVTPVRGGPLPSAADYPAGETMRAAPAAVLRIAQ
jgi:hypothetical protein